MIRGKVNQTGQARVTLEMLGRSGLFQPVEVVLDTGFTGDILLPPDTIQNLEVSRSPAINARLASGQEILLPCWRGIVLWHDKPHIVVVAESGGEPLLGMNLLQGSRVTLDARLDGDVTIEELAG